jgi:hypothetical protein
MGTVFQRTGADAMRRLQHDCRNGGFNTVKDTGNNGDISQAI